MKSKLMKTIYFIDLDGTILHHHRDAEENETVCELSRNRYISIIHNNVLEILKKKPENVVILTSRSYAQCLRVPEVANMPFILANNGGTLIKNRCIDLNWELESQQLIEKIRDRINEAYIEINSYRCNSISYVNSMYLAYQGDDKEKVEKLGEKYKDIFDTFRSNHGIDLVPKGLTKGDSVKRFIAEIIKINPEELNIIGFGDSEQDEHMCKNVFITGKDGHTRVDTIFADMWRSTNE